MLFCKNFPKFLYIGVFCLVNTVFGAQCEKDKCVYGSIGIGGGYYDFGAKDIKSYVGYASLESRFVYGQRLQAVLGGRVGGGSSRATNLAEFAIADKSSLFVFDYYAKIGLNIATRNAPLFINVFAERDTHNARIGGSKGFEREVILIGAEGNGYIPIGQSTYFDYGVGYAWVGGANYSFSSLNENLKPKGYSYALNAHVGFSRHINERTMYYVRLIGKYQDINATKVLDSVSYPSSKDTVVMLEIGIKGFNK